MGVEICSPFPQEYDALLWGWLQQFPNANFDDEGPQTEGDFTREMDERRAAGERTWYVLLDGEPVGAVAFRPITSRYGMTHGICFTKEVHGKGVARTALQMILAQLDSEGVEKIAALFFAHNHRIYGLLKTLGFVEEGLLKKQTLQNGKAVDVRLMARFRP